MLTTTETLKEASCLQIYLNAIDALNNMHFDTGAKAFFRHSLQKKDDPMTPVSVYRYYQETRLKLRNHVMPFFPRDMATMKSAGRGFHESCNEVFVKAYREGLVKTKKNTLRKKLIKSFHPPSGNSPKHLGTLVLLPKFFAATHNWQRRLPTSWPTKLTCPFLVQN